jgi:hypothetical protein
MPFDKDNANTRRVLITDNTGVELDGRVRVDVWDVGTTAYVKAVPGVPSGGAVTVSSLPATPAPTAYATEFDYDAASPPNLVYFGIAVPGTATSAAGWQIRKFTTSGSNPTSMLWAGGSGAFTNIWDNRAGLTYS